MSDDPIQAALQRLQETTALAAVRLDDDKQLRGRVAVLPSAYNPPTRAHLHLLELASEVERIEYEAALLTTRNVAKGIEGASPANRVGMLLAARSARPGLAVLAANQARIVDQATALRIAFPEAAFDFVVGHDTLVRLFDARYYEGDMDLELEPFFAYHRVIATNRGDVSAEEVEAYVAELPIAYASRIVVRALDDGHHHVSSSDARARAGDGDDAEEVPPEVAAYIRAHGLYRSESGEGPGGLAP